MELSVSVAKGQLLDLVRRAEAGEEIVLTRRGRAVIRLVPLAVKPTVAERRAAIDRIVEAARHRRLEGPPGSSTAARSQDFLYDDLGLPT